MKDNDTWYRCTICGREGTIGRCCGDETRIPLNALAMEEQRRYRYINKAYKKYGSCHGTDCDPVKVNGKCVVGNGKQLVKFSDGSESVVIRRCLRLIKPTNAI